jgi:1-phosphofructokinase
MHPLVLVLNPAVDVEWRVDAVVWEEKNTILSERRWAGGKGVNVVRWLRHLGSVPKLMIPLGGANGQELRRHILSEIQAAPAGGRDETSGRASRCKSILPRPGRAIAPRGRLALIPIRLDQETRANIIVTTRAGRQLRFNPPGPCFSAGEWRSVLTAVGRAKARCNCLVMSGSLPRGLAPDAYARLVREASKSGVKTLLDCDGPPFAAAVKARPFLVKPNQHELAQGWGRPLRSERDVAIAIRHLAAKTRGWVLLSRGGKGGILANVTEGCWFEGTVPQLKVTNTIGAGDALLAAVARQIERGQPPVEWLRWGLATGTAATQVPAGTLPTLPSIHALLRRIDVQTGPFEGDKRQRIFQTRSKVCVPGCGKTGWR